MSKQILEDTQDVLANCIISINEFTKDNLKEHITFMKKAITHLHDNVITQEALHKSNNAVINELLGRINKNIIAFSRAALDNLTVENYEDKKPMLISWLSYYEKQVINFLSNEK